VVKPGHRTHCERGVVLTICRGLIHSFTFSELRDLHLVELSRILSTGDSAAIPFQMYPKSSGQSHRQVARSPSSARHELLAWAKARNLRDRAAGYSNDARVASDSGVQRRLNDIAQHYRLAAAAEAKDAGRLGNERREKSKASENGGSDGRPEIDKVAIGLRWNNAELRVQLTDRQCARRFTLRLRSICTMLRGQHCAVRGSELATQADHLVRMRSRVEKSNLTEP
jgi:hypothetical protein